MKQITDKNEAQRIHEGWLAAGSPTVSVAVLAEREKALRGIPHIDKMREVSNSVRPLPPNMPKRTQAEICTDIQRDVTEQDEKDVLAILKQISNDIEKAALRGETNVRYRSGHDFSRAPRPAMEKIVVNELRARGYDVENRSTNYSYESGMSNYSEFTIDWR